MRFRVFGHCGASDPEGRSTGETENSRGSREVKPPPVGAPRGVMIIYASLANLSYRGSEVRFQIEKELNVSRGKSDTCRIRTCALIEE